MRLLIVEDDSEQADYLHRQLSARGYAVDLAAQAADADYLIQQFSYDLILLDLGLPDKEGLQLLQHWRSQQVHLPVLILTGRNAWYERVDGLKAGADDYLGKPFYLEELLARIQALLRRAQGESAPLLQRGELILDESKQAVLKEGQMLSLTGSEYRLLHYLMHHPGQILSKSRLQDQLYDLEQEVASNVVEVYIRRLRQKIGAEWIQTQRGQGYRFQVPP